MDTKDKRPISATAVVILVMALVGSLALFAYAMGWIQLGHGHQSPLGGEAARLFVQNPDATSRDFGNHTHPSGQGPHEDAFTLLAVGDVLIHDSLINGAKVGEDYDFRPMFSDTASIIEGADFALFDMEGTFRGAPYAGYPSFSTPEALAQNLKDLGMDAAVTANNHCMDFDVPAMKRTVEVLEAAQLKVLGTRCSNEAPPYLIKDLEGIRVGFAAFTYETPKVAHPDGLRRSINHLRIPKDAEPLIDSFGLAPEDLAGDIKRMEQRVAQMRKAGAEIVVFSMHWGREYEIHPDTSQRAYAQALCNAGVDLVLGCGPHVIQPIERLVSDDGQHSMLCFFSMGNFVSNQQPDTGNSGGLAEDGLMALVQFKRRPEGGLYLSKAGAIPTYVYKRYPEGPDAGLTKALVLRVLAPSDLADAALALEASLARTEGIMALNRLEGVDFELLSDLPDWP